MKNRKFAQFIFVGHEADSDGSTYLVAREKAIDVLDDDGPMRVATYQLVEVNELSKRVVSKPSK